MSKLTRVFHLVKGRDVNVISSFPNGVISLSLCVVVITFDSKRFASFSSSLFGFFSVESLFIFCSLSIP